MMERVEGRRPAARWNRYDAVRRIVEERDLAERRAVRCGTWPLSIDRSLLLLLAKMMSVGSQLLKTRLSLMNPIGANLSVVSSQV